MTFKQLFSSSNCIEVLFKVLLKENIIAQKQFLGKYFYLLWKPKY